jgi:hypothetical protein
VWGALASPAGAPGGAKAAGPETPEPAGEGQPSERLMKLVFLALDHGLESVQASGQALTPFLVHEEAGKLKVQRFVTGTLEGSVAQARAAARALAGRATMLAVVYDGFVTLDGVRSDAILAEAQEQRLRQALLFAQRYRRGGAGDVERVGNVACLGVVA